MAPKAISFSKIAIFLSRYNAETGDVVVGRITQVNKGALIMHLHICVRFDLSVFT